MTADDVPKAGLAGYWRLDEATGGAVHDASSHANHGTVRGARWETHDGRAGLSFNGAGASVDIQNHPSLELANDITIAAWICKARTNDEERWDAILSKTPGRWDYELLTSMARSDEPAFYGRDTAPNEVYAGDVAPHNRWTHLAVARTGTVVTFYLDGRRLATSVQEGAFLRSGGPLQIGHDGAEKNGGMLGWISSVALYDRGLADEEIEALMQAMD